jgi:hypothetical protein
VTFCIIQNFLLVDEFQTKLVLIQFIIATDIFMGEKFSDVKTMNETFVGNYTIFKKGYYVDQLLAFTNVFKRNQIMVISSVGMYKDTAGVMENIRKFINVEEDDSFLGQLPHGTYETDLSYDDCTCMFEVTFNLPDLHPI